MQNLMFTCFWITLICPTVVVSGMEKKLEQVEIPEPSLPVCEAILMPVSDEYTYIHHNSIQIGVFKYIEKAP